MVVKQHVADCPRPPISLFTHTHTPSSSVVPATLPASYFPYSFTHNSQRVIE